MCVHSTTLTPFAMCKYSQCAIRYVQLSLLSLSYNKCLSYNKSVPLEIVTLHASSALIYILVSTYLIRNKSVSMKCPCRLVLSYSTATHSSTIRKFTCIASHARASSWQLLFLHVKSRSRTAFGMDPVWIWPPGAAVQLHILHTVTDCTSTSKRRPRCAVGTHGFRSINSLLPSM
jgi:hypothetical protein